jgi:diacylglycerol O-acyltransferase / wax synthase
MPQLNTLDSFFLYTDSGHAGMHGAFLQIYAPSPEESPPSRYKRLIRHIESKLDASPVFRRRIERAPFEADRAHWVDGGEVDLGHHVRHSALPLPGDDAQLADHYARVCAVPMDTTRPLWEIHVIDGLDAVDGAPKGSFALIVKFHHAGVDGVSATEIMSALHSATPERAASAATRRRPTVHAVEEAPPGAASAAMSSAILGARLGINLATKLPSVLGALLKRLRPQADAGGPKKPVAPRCLLNAQISADRSYTYLSIGLDNIKLIREHVPEATVNDVYLAVCGGALRRFLQARDALPQASLVAAVPVNVRTEGEQGQAGNQFSVMRVPLFTDEPSMRRRLKHIAEYTQASKSAMCGSKGARQSMAWLNLLPGPLLAVVGTTFREGRLAARIAPIVNLIVTNVPGPRQAIYLDGNELIDINGAPPVMDGLGLVIAASSYRGDLKVAVAACRRIMPDPLLMRRAMSSAFAELLEVAGKPLAPRKPSTALAPTAGKPPRVRKPANARPRTSAKPSTPRRSSTT